MIGKWNRTRIGRMRLDAILEDDKYLDRLLIGRDSPIDGGVYLGGNEREAIVVNSCDSPQLQLAYKEVKKRSLDDSGEVRRGKILQSVYELTNEKMKFSEIEVARVIDEHSVDKDGKISLGIFLQEGYGVCRHMALLSAFLLEKFVEEGHIRGKPSVDRNSCFHNAHAWCRYKNYSGEVYILDSAKSFIGTLEDSKEIMNWEYFRDNDKINISD
jgi:hypothetical protein